MKTQAKKTETLVNKSTKGRKPKYSSGETLKVKANEYFYNCTSMKRIPTKAGLCLALGISRDTYSEYRKQFPDAIRAMDLYMEDKWAERLSGQSATGAIFYLKNAFREDYKDRVETDITTGGQQIQIYIPERK